MILHSFSLSHIFHSFPHTHMLSGIRSSLSYNRFLVCKKLSIWRLPGSQLIDNLRRPVYQINIGKISSAAHLKTQSEKPLWRWCQNFWIPHLSELKERRYPCLLTVPCDQVNKLKVIPRKCHNLIHIPKFQTILFKFINKVDAVVECVLMIYQNTVNGWSDMRH